MYEVILRPDDNGTILVICPDLPEVTTFGEDETDAVHRAANQSSRIVNGGGADVGSGGWANIVEKYSKAKQYCDLPFEVRHKASRKITVPIKGEWIGEQINGARGHAISLDAPVEKRWTWRPNSRREDVTDAVGVWERSVAELTHFS